MGGAEIGERPQFPRIGLIVNPVAGIGGRVGLKGSDGPEIQRRAFELGASPSAPGRAAQALERLLPLAARFELIVCPAEMGEDSARAAGLAARVIGSITPGKTSSEDTRRAAAEMAGAGVALLLFAGGDGTARDIFDAVGTGLPALGIPAGVKIHSAVFATSPARAGELAASFLGASAVRTCEAEVVDLDEEAVRHGTLAPRLYGYLQVPLERRALQNLKTAGSAGGAESLAGIAAAAVERMEDDCLYIIGPGTTTRAITDRLGLRKTLLGVDVVANRRTVAEDANEARILGLIRGQKARIIVTPIGGQGCLFGRGNQQISPEVISIVGRSNLIVVSAAAKIHALGTRPLWADTGDEAVDRMLAGYVRVIAGYREEIVVRVV